MNKMLQMFDPVEYPGSRGLHPNNCVHFQENSSSLFVPILSCWIAKHRASKHNFGNAILATDQFCLFWKLNFLKLWELFFYFLLPECLAWIGVRDWSRGLPPSGISLACLVGGPHNAQDEVKIPNGLKWGREVANNEWLWAIRNEIRTRTLHCVKWRAQIVCGQILRHLSVGFQNTIFVWWEGQMPWCYWKAVFEGIDKVCSRSESFLSKNTHHLHE